MPMKIPSAADAPRRLPSYGSRKRLGMILASPNTVAEADAVAMLPEDVSLHTTRLALRGTRASELQAMAAQAEEAAGLLADARVDLIVFHCTAASTVDPDMGDRIAGRIHASTGIPATATSQALIAAARRLGLSRIVMLTPYAQEVNDSEVAFFAHHGVRVLAERGFVPPPGQGSPSASPQHWLERALASRHPEADGYLLGCTNIRVVSVIGALEQALGKPVITSNQTMAWHCLRTMGVSDTVPGYGALLRG
ncbi:MAG: hypothetical protein AB7G13_19525 [Lautropia sp.]